MTRQKLLSITVRFADSTGENVREIAFAPDGGPAGEQIDLNRYVALFWGRVQTQTPPDVLGGFYYNLGEAGKAERVDLLWNGGLDGAPMDGAAELPAFLLKDVDCVPVGSDDDGLSL